MGNTFLSRFGSIWKGGYCEGDPADPMGESSYGIFGFHSSLYLLNLVCIRPFVDANSTVLEIGPGRGAWTKVIAAQNPRKIYAVDVVDPDYAGFWEHVGRPPQIEHIVVSDFSLDGVPDNSIDYFFSFGCFCHLKPEMCEAYIRSLARKMKPGSNGFLMIADYDKLNACMRDIYGKSIWRSFTNRRSVILRMAFRFSMLLFRDRFTQRPLAGNELNGAEPPAWFHFGVPRACAALEQAGFQIVRPDMEVTHRDPIIHFRR